MPELTQWIARELTKKYAVMKERRKAREEHALSRPKKKGKDQEQGLARSSHAIDWASDGTACFNELFGFSTPSSSGALGALFAVPGFYSDEGSTQRPYVKSKATKDGEASRGCRCLESLGFSVHELSTASRDVSFVGLNFSEGSKVSVKSDNMRRSLLRRGACSGSALRVAMGQVLSLFSASYQFMPAVGERPQRIWPRVRRELWAFRSTLPLLFTEIDIPRHGAIAAAGAPLFGIGARARAASPHKAGEVSRYAGRWGCQVAGAPRDAAPIEGIEDLQKFLEASGALSEEVPEDVLQGPWVAALASKVLVDAHILELEGAALMMAAEHVLRQAPSLAGEAGLAGRRAGSPSLLESLAATPGTELLRAGAATLFLQHCPGMGADRQGANELDTLLDGSKLMAGLSHLIPELHKMATGELLRASRCLVAWRRRIPPRTRLPLPRAAAFALARCLRDLGFPRMCLLVVVTFVAYLRPREAFLLRGKHLVAPKVVAGRQCSSRSLLLHDATLGDPGKTGMFDAAALLDRREWLLPCLEALKALSLDAGCLWDFSPAELQRHFAVLVKVLGLESLPPRLHSLRRGFASDDLAAAARTLEELRVRGRWAAIASLKGQGKTARLLLEMAKVPEDARVLGRALEANLMSAMAEGFESPLSPAVEQLLLAVGRASSALQAEQALRALREGGRLNGRAHGGGQAGLARTLTSAGLGLRIPAGHVPAERAGGEGLPAASQQRKTEVQDEGHQESHSEAEKHSDADEDTGVVETADTMEDRREEDEDDDDDDWLEGGGEEDEGGGEEEEDEVQDHLDEAEEHAASEAAEKLHVGAESGMQSERPTQEGEAASDVGAEAPRATTRQASAAKEQPRRQDPADWWPPLPAASAGAASSGRRWAPALRGDAAEGPAGSYSDLASELRRLEAENRELRTEIGQERFRSQQLLKQREQALQAHQRDLQARQAEAPPPWGLLMLLPVPAVRFEPWGEEPNSKDVRTARAAIVEATF
ncbi:unnamed protein product [Prorocentrum cordatum]|uniref:Uncharacterized protein n=1 Tax=Prorocentrum cordatum TaxID=2364126 RepID=A0ABN9QQF3_9DINO|nr:unnamed protein product [Polarella glacialis]